MKITRNPQFLHLSSPKPRGARGKSKHDTACYKCGRLFFEGDWVSWGVKGKFAGITTCPSGLGCQSPKGHGWGNESTLFPWVHPGDWIRFRDGDNGIRRFSKPLPTPVPKESKPEPKPEPKHEPKPARSHIGLHLEQVISDFINESIQPQLEDFKKTLDVTIKPEDIDRQVKESLKERLGDIVPKTVPVTFELPERKAKVETPHFQLEKLTRLALEYRHNVFLYGDPGSGKSEATKHLAQIKFGDDWQDKWGYVSLTRMTSESKVFGFIDANGVFRETILYKLFTEGGVFCFDEMGLANAGLVNAFNTAFAGDFGSFPCGIVKRHPDFILVAADNTTGRGGDPRFPERQDLGTAFRDRFTYLDWPIDEKLEQSIALGINSESLPWISYIRKLRAFCLRNYPAVEVSPRATFKGAELLSGNHFKPDEIAQMVIFKGLDSDSISVIESEVSYES